MNRSPTPYDPFWTAISFSPGNLPCRAIIRPSMSPAASSRVMEDIISDRHRECARKLKSVLATYRKAEDLINIGAYAAGSNPEIDYAIQMIGKINAYLQQDVQETVMLEDSIEDLIALFR